MPLPIAFHIAKIGWMLFYALTAFGKECNLRIGKRCGMPNVVLKREGGLTIEADLTFEQIKELVGVNGHLSGQPRPQSQPALPGIPDYEGFYSAMPERGKTFVKVLKEHPKGIEAGELAPLLDFENANQIGGLTGAGLSKTATRYSISMRDVYTTDVKFPGGKRTRMYYPGKLLKGK